jgi:hypothetical protein
LFDYIVKHGKVIIKCLFLYNRVVLFFGVEYSVIKQLGKGNHIVEFFT